MRIVEAVFRESYVSYVVIGLVSCERRSETRTCPVHPNYKCYQLKGM